MVALYEQNDKPSSALEFIHRKLGGPSVSDYEKLQAKKSDIQIKYNELFAKHLETLRVVNYFPSRNDPVHHVEQYPTPPPVYSGKHGSVMYSSSSPPLTSRDTILHIQVPKLYLHVSCLRLTVND
ncbi:unnamed protein product [Eruca vesicaria subsp. sativa]|uniref:Uncharacterized protein n=1 Tax=Eruca vesicaria subsp. sativa TaxID=29727 RepID=A0ABC8MA32_ERUVS|nr:unnamed protein product [Eruca vesicaria subsp. sativa]